MPDIHRARIIFLLSIMNFFLYSLPNQFFQKIAFFCILVKENQEAFSERYSLVSVVLEGLVKICKKYMELNPFLLLSCSLEE